MTSVRCYTLKEILAKLQMGESTLRRLRAQGRLPMLEELRPRLGRKARFKAELVDRYLLGEWGTSKFFRAHRRK